MVGLDGFIGFGTMVMFPVHFGVTEWGFLVCLYRLVFLV